MVELLIVIVIIAILAVISIVTYNGIMNRAYRSRAYTELTSISKATVAYYEFNFRYPTDVDRNLPAELTPYINGSNDNWPQAPWPGSVYDYDTYTGSDGEEAVQISIRFCPMGGPMSACRFPNEPWARNFRVNSSAYWCIKGKCRAHSTESDSYPGYCVNCHELY